MKAILNQGNGVVAIQDYPNIPQYRAINVPILNEVSMMASLMREGEVPPPFELGATQIVLVRKWLDTSRNVALYEQQWRG